MDNPLEWTPVCHMDSLEHAVPKGQRHPHCRKTTPIPITTSEMRTAIWVREEVAVKLMQVGEASSACSRCWGGCRYCPIGTRALRGIIACQLPVVWSSLLGQIETDI